MLGTPSGGRSNIATAGNVPRLHIVLHTILVAPAGSTRRRATLEMSADMTTRIQTLGCEPASVRISRKRPPSPGLPEEHDQRVPLRRSAEAEAAGPQQPHDVFAPPRPAADDGSHDRRLDRSCGHNFGLDQQSFDGECSAVHILVH